MCIRDSAQAVQDAPQENTAFARYMSDAMFLIPTPQVLQKIITGLDELYEHDLSEQDMQGEDVYKRQTKGSFASLRRSLTDRGCFPETEGNQRIRKC